MPVEGRIPSVESQRMSVALLVVLTLVTCGLYSPIWFLKRRRFLNALDSSEREIPEGLPIAIIIVWGSSLLLSAAMGALESDGKALEALDRLATMAGGVMLLMLSFRAKNRIAQHMLRAGQHTPMSGLATFFLQTYYLQYKINLMPDHVDVARRFD
ncbi:MAG: DUF4234 domain-containing protein [Polyangiaceae bacterium]|nr:DUF4234 domain-containing protein [Polyangiaceae bacterium]